MRLAATMFIAALLFGCSGSKGKTDKDDNSLGLSLGKTVRVSKKGEIIERFDLNSDGKTDVVRVYKMVGPKGSREKRLIRTELDINFDNLLRGRQGRRGEQGETGNQTAHGGETIVRVRGGQLTVR